MNIFLGWILLDLVNGSLVQRLLENTTLLGRMRSLARLWELEEQLLEPREEQLWSPSGLEEQLVDPQLGQEHLGDILLGPKFKCPGMHQDRLIKENNQQLQVHNCII